MLNIPTLGSEKEDKIVWVRQFQFDWTPVLVSRPRREAYCPTPSQESSPVYFLAFMLDACLHES